MNIHELYECLKFRSNHARTRFNIMSTSMQPQFKKERLKSACCVLFRNKERILCVHFNNGGITHDGTTDHAYILCKVLSTFEAASGHRSVINAH